MIFCGGLGRSRPPGDERVNLSVALAADLRVHQADQSGVGNLDLVHASAAGLVVTGSIALHRNGNNGLHFVLPFEAM